MAKAGLEYEWATYLAGHAIGAADEKSLAYMKPLLNQIDWVDINNYGEYPSHFAWLLIQHADRDPQFQQEILQRLKPYIKNGDIQKSDYAYLYDRVAVNTNQKNYMALKA